MTTKKNEVAKADNVPSTEVAHSELSMGQRFMAKVQSEMVTSTGINQVTDSQKRLIQSYYIAIDQALKSAEEKRLGQSEKFRPNLAYTWKNVNMETLAIRVMAFSKIGFDPSLPNHLSFVFHKNKAGTQYEVTFLEGYRGKELKAKKYALDVPIATTVELKYTTDHFRPIKKDHKNPVETYEFEIKNPFERGEIEGGFYYHQYADATKNKLVIMSAKDIEKRKPQYAAAEFWGGDKDEYKDGAKTGKKIQVEGWKDEMYRKTVARAAFGDLTIDPEKIDQNYMQLLANEQELPTEDVSMQIEQGAHKENLTIDAHHTEVTEDVAPEENKEEEKPKPTTLF